MTGSPGLEPGGRHDLHLRRRCGYGGYGLHLGGLLREVLLRCHHRRAAASAARDKEGSVGPGAFGFALAGELGGVLQRHGAIGVAPAQGLDLGVHRLVGAPKDVVDDGKQYDGDEDERHVDDVPDGQAVFFALFFALARHSRHHESNQEQDDADRDEEEGETRVSVSFEFPHVAVHLLSKLAPLPV